MLKQEKCIRLKKDSRWKVCYIKDYANKKNQYAFFHSKPYDTVQKKLAFFTSPSEKSSPYNNITFNVVSHEWISMQAAQLKESSIAKYRNILSLYLLPEYGSQPIQEIRRNDIVAFSSFLLTKGKNGNAGLAPKTVNSILSVLKSILKYGAQEKNLSITDLSKISVKQPRKPMRILSTVEQKRLSKYLLEHLTPCNLGILICLYTGLRIGEICALKWSDVCFDESCIFVHQSMQRIQTKNGTKNTAIFILPPKSSCSIRQIPIPAELVYVMKKYQKPANAFLLSGEENKLIEPRCLENRFKVIASACSIDSITFHSIRHTFATRCVELGFDVKSLSEILGHASVNITLNRYVHPSMELKQRNMNMLSVF